MLLAADADGLDALAVSRRQHRQRGFGGAEAALRRRARVHGKRERHRITNTRRTELLWDGAEAAGMRDLGRGEGAL